MNNIKIKTTKLSWNEWRKNIPDFNNTPKMDDDVLDKDGVIVGWEELEKESKSNSNLISLDISTYPYEPKDGLTPLGRILNEGRTLGVCRFDDNGVGVRKEGNGHKYVYELETEKGTMTPEIEKELDKEYGVYVTTGIPQYKYEGTMMGVGYDRDDSGERGDRTGLVKFSQIKDYNSMWRDTESGWDTPKQIQEIPKNHSKEVKGSGNDNISPLYIYPYIIVDGLYWRWDSYQIREITGHLRWTKENFKKFESSSEHKIWNHKPIRVTKMGRNDLCNCESGLKFKKCCMN